MKVRQRGRIGFTLIEVIIASVIFTFVAIGVIGSPIFSSRTTRINSNAVLAKNIAQSYFERINIDVFENVGPERTLADGTIVGYNSIPFNDPNPVWLDQAKGINCAINIEFTGFGRATAGSVSSITDSKVSWETNEWQGKNVYLVDGLGAGKFRTIQSNTATVLTLSGDALQPVPGLNTAYMIGNGKTVRITTTWEYLGKEYSQQMGSLVINFRRDPSLGF